MKKKRVFVVIGYFAIAGGAESQAVLLGIEMKKRGFEPLFFSRRPVRKNNQYKIKLEKAGIRVFSPPMWLNETVNIVRKVILRMSLVFYPVYKFVRRKNIEKFILEINYELGDKLERGIFDFVLFLSLSYYYFGHKPCLLHSHRGDFGSRVAVSWAYIFNVPMLYTEHGDLYEDYLRSKKFRELGRFSERNMTHIERNCIVTVLTSGIKERARKIFRPNTKIEVLPNFVEDYEIKPIANSQRLSADSVVLGSIGRLSHEKGFDILIDALNFVNKRCDNFRLEICGDGIEKERLERQILRYGLNGCVKFNQNVGEIEIAEFINSIDIFVLSSRAEGMPLSILSAMACGKPVVATRVGGIPETVIDGVCGILVEPEAPEEMASAIMRLIENPELRKKMGDEGKRRYLQNYTPEVVGERWMQIYEGIEKR